MPIMKSNRRVCTSALSDAKISMEILEKAVQNRNYSLAVAEAKNVAKLMLHVISAASVLEARRR